MKNKKSPASNVKPTGKENAVHNTSGAIMPDAHRRQGASEKDVETAFGASVSTKPTKRDR